MHYNAAYLRSKVSTTQVDDVNERSINKNVLHECNCRIYIYYTTIHIEYFFLIKHLNLMSKPFFQSFAV